MSRNWKQAIIGTTLSGVLAGVMGCTSWPPEFQPTPLLATPAPKQPPKVVRRAAPPRKVVKPAPKPVAAKKVVKPVAEEPATAPPVIVPPLGGGGSGGSGGGGWG